MGPLHLDADALKEGDETPDVAACEGFGRCWDPALNVEKRLQGGHLVNPITHNRDGSVYYGVMHIKEGKVNLHPISNLAEIYPNVVDAQSPVALQAAHANTIPLWPQEQSIILGYAGSTCPVRSASACQATIQ